MRKILPMLLLLGLAAFAGCFGGNDDDGDDGTPVPGLVPVQDRHLLPYVVDGEFSYTFQNGTYRILPAVSVDVPVALPPTEGGNALTGDAHVNLGLFLPDVPAGTKVPVIVDAGPYYSASTGVPDLQTEGDTVATEPAGRLGRFLIENFVPQGYAVAQLSVFGTGDSNHCQDLMGTSEQLGLDAAVTWLGTQEWSNGAVALIGRSYDGSTPWEAAMFGNPYLKSIVPISGLSSQFDLMYHNGSSESRGAGVLYALYAAMTVDGDAEDPQSVLCPDYLTGAPEGLKATLAGNPTDADPYWAERIFLDRALANYNGSIYLVHGLQDWNVDPHMAFPAYNLFEEKGVPVKALLGQWAHMYPDRPSEHAGLGSGRGGEAYPYSVRYDWAQDLLEWFDWTLKGTGPQPDLHVEVQDNQGLWRIEPTWPPAGETRVVPLAEMTAEGNMVIPEQASVTFTLQPFENETRIAGQPHLDLTVTPTTPAGQVYALLTDGKGLHLGHGIMNLRYADSPRSGTTPVVPLQPMAIRIEFEPMDAVVPAGTTLQIILSETGEDYVAPDMGGILQVDLAQGDLELPLVHPAADQFFTPPVWEGVAEAGEPQP